MERGYTALAFAHLQHWLRKEDLYSQQSPYTYALYLGIAEHLKTHFSSKDERKFAPGPRSSWKDHPTPTQAAALLCQYFCQQTPALHVLELGTGRGNLTYLLDQAVTGTLHSIETPGPLLEITGQGKDYPRSSFHSGQVREKLPDLLKSLDRLDFLVINTPLSITECKEVLPQCFEKMHSESMLAMGKIHQSKEMEENWAVLKKDPRISLSLDFFEYGIGIFRYPGPKTHLVLGL